MAGLTASRGASALALGQTDDFEDGTTQGWVINLLGSGSPPTPPANVASGGPGGADDNYLLLTSTGSFGAGGRMNGINVSQWAGNFTAAGITAISASVRNFGASELSLRLYFADPAGGPATNQAISTDPILLPSGSGWTSVVFPIAPGDLSALTGTAAAALSGATMVRILHGATASFPPDPITASLGIDDFSAVPEPGAGVLLALGLAALAARRRGYAPRSGVEPASGS
jgi:hypothetical protein